MAEREARGPRAGHAARPARRGDPQAAFSRPPDWCGLLEAYGPGRIGPRTPGRSRWPAKPRAGQREHWQAGPRGPPHQASAAGGHSGAPGRARPHRGLAGRGRGGLPWRAAAAG